MTAPEVGRCVMCGEEEQTLYTYPNGGTVADREVPRCLRCWSWFHAEDDGWQAAEVWAEALGVEVFVGPSDDPDHDGGALDLEREALPMVATVPDADAFAWVDASAPDWLRTLRERLAVDLADVGQPVLATVLRNLP